MTSEIRQRKLNEQRQKIKENQYKKSIQQLKSIQMNDNDNKITLKYSYKDEYSPLIKSKSDENENSSIFAYNGPELFKFSSSISRSENVVEKYSYTDIPEDVLKIDNFSKKCKKESIQKAGFNYLNMNSCGNDNDIDKDEDFVEDVTECKEELRKIEQIQPNFVNLDDSNNQSALDDDLDDTNLSSIERIPPVQAENQPDKIESSEEDKSEDNMLQSFPESLLNSHMEIENFVTKPAPEQYIVKCRITRDKRGVDKGMFPTYYLHLERQNHKPLFLLAARRRKLSKTSNYLISCDATDMKRSGFGYLAKLRSNFIGTHFTLYDNGQNPDSPNFSKKPFRKELCAVIYETNVLGFKGPRKMTVIIPGMKGDKTPITFKPNSNDGDLLECCRTRQMDNLLELHNKKPVWNEDSQSYVLNFQGRVTQASVKNFQIINDNDADYIIMQFGRTSDNSFSMDYAYPMSAVQAFGLALSSFDGKIACE